MDTFLRENEIEFQSKEDPHDLLIFVRRINKEMGHLRSMFKVDACKHCFQNLFH